MVIIAGRSWSVGRGPRAFPHRLPVGHTLQGCRLAGDLGLPLRPLQGQVAGYAKHVHVVETYRALREAVARAELGAADRAFMDPLMSVLKVAASSPALDVVIVGAE